MRVFIKSKFHGNFAYFISGMTLYGGNKQFFFSQNPFFNTLKDDRGEALLALARRSPSISLANTAYLLRGAMESGGSKYNLVLVESADRIRKVIAGRNAARAKANESMITAVVVPAILIFVLISLSQSSVVKQSLHSFLVQIVMGIAFGPMVIGYFIIKNIVDDAV